MATLIKGRRYPKTKTPKQLRLFAVPISTEYIAVYDINNYTDFEANTFHINMDIHENDSGSTTLALPGNTFSKTRLLGALVTCATQFARATRIREPYAKRINRFSKAFNLPEMRNLPVVFVICKAICNTPADVFSLIEANLLLIFFARTFMLLTLFSPTKDTRAHSLMTPEETIAQLNAREHFSEGDVLPVAKPLILLHPDICFCLTLITLASSKQPPPPPLLTTSMGTDDGAAPYLTTLLEATPMDSDDEFRPDPWIPQTIIIAAIPLQWTCLNRGYGITHSATLSFCPGSTVRGVVKPYFTTNSSSTIRIDILVVSIAQNTVFKRASSLGSRISCPRVV
jgi:hypothetical protein